MQNENTEMANPTSETKGIASLDELQNLEVLRTELASSF